MLLRYIIIISLISFIPVQAQNFTEGFDVVDSIYANGWVRNNNSAPQGEDGWEQDFGNFTAHSGASTSSIVVSYTSITSGQSGDISNWLITPSITCTAGDSIIF